MRRMKKWLSAAAVCCAAGSPAWGEVWDIRLPETSLVPSYARASYLSRMHERHGGSHLGMQEYTVNMPFVDAHRSHVGDWWYNVQANITSTIMDVGGGLNLRRDALFEFGVPVTVIHPMQGGRDHFMLTLMPRYAGDSAVSAHAWDLGIVADYCIKHSETLSYSLGVAASPRFTEHVIMPSVSLHWQVTPEWLVRLRGGQLAALYRATDRLSIGPALSMQGGTWMISTEQKERIFRVRSLVVALAAEYDFADAGQPHRMLRFSLGSAVATSAQYCDRTASMNALETHHYKPGLAASLEMDFRF